MGLHTLLKVFPHVEHNTLVIPPVNIMLFGLFEILFPSIHHCSYHVYLFNDESCLCLSLSDKD